MALFSCFPDSFPSMSFSRKHVRQETQTIRPPARDPRPPTRDPYRYPLSAHSYHVDPWTSTRQGAVLSEGADGGLAELNMTTVIMGGERLLFQQSLQPGKIHQSCRPQP